MNVTWVEGPYSWPWRFVVWVPLLLWWGIYALGWWRLYQRGCRRLATIGRLGLHTLAVLAVFAALQTPLYSLSRYLFSINMAHHMLLIMVAPPLFWLARPFPFMVWAFPRALRRLLPALLARNRTARTAFRYVTAPGVSWLLFAGTFWTWHTPEFYDAAMRRQGLEDLQHLTFLVTGLLFWWHVTAAAPHIHGRIGYGWRIAYVMAALVQNTILAVAITFAGNLWYTYYTTVPRLWDLPPLNDQRLGGAIMWVPGGMMYGIAAVALLYRIISAEEKKPPMPEEYWTSAFQ